VQTVKASLLAALSFVALATSSALAAAPVPLTDKPGVKDHPLFTRMPGFFVVRMPDDYKERAFEAKEFKTGNKGGDKKRVEGKWFYQRCVFDTTRPEKPSDLQILRNFQQATRAAGGEVIYEGGRETTLKFTRDGKEIWAQVLTGGSGREYTLTVVEAAGMRQDIVANADSFRAALGASGHVEVPGILFDTGKSEIKPQSEAALAEVAKLLKADPKLAVWVVGHTDSVGTTDANVALSAARADAVTKALVARHGIEASRLDAHGNGPFAPVASNATEDGRARNRRVELVAR
jgi:outer membrane protein OmpA-like peptidoglycan-associated protein